MQRIFGAIRQAFRKSILILSLVSLVSLSSLLIFSSQPSYAAVSPSQQVTPEEEFERAQSSESPEVREEAYEEATKEAKSPRNEEKAYEENLKGYKEENPDGGLVEGAKGLLEKVTGGGSTGGLN
jgi:hypothetical protein